MKAEETKPVGELLCIDPKTGKGLVRIQELVIPVYVDLEDMKHWGITYGTCGKENK
jgi:hypothetical protein